MEQSDLHLGDLLRIVLRRIWVVVLFFVVVVSVVTIGTFRATPIYEASAVLIIERPSSPNVAVEELLGSVSYLDSKKYYQTQYSLLKSPRILRDLMSSINFSAWPDFEDATDEEILAALESRISIEPHEQSFLVDVSMSGRDPEQLARAVNRLVRIYIDHNQEQTRQTIASGASFLEKEIPELQQKLETSFQELTAFQENNNVLSDEENKKIILEEFKTLRASLVEMEDRNEELNGRYETMTEARKDGASAEVLTLILGDENVQRQVDKLREEKRLLEQDAMVLSAKPSYVMSELGALREQIKGKETAIAREIEMAFLKLENELEETRRLIKVRKAREATLFQERQRLYLTLNEFNRLQDVYKRNYDLFDQFIQRHNELAAARNAQPNNVRVEFPAEPPLRPVRPRKALNLALAVAVGLFGGLLLAFFFEYIDDTIKGREDVSRSLRLPPLGFVPTISDRRQDSGSRDLITFKSPQSCVSEAYRSIRTGIAFAGAGDERQVILITSASPREGKTTTAINIAVAMAQSGQKTLLVDTDLRRPRIHQTFGLENSRGLTSVFINDFRLEEVIMPTEVENLYILPCGPIPPNPSEILGSGKMREILSQLRTMFQKVVMDSPPTVAVTDASILGRLADSTILVVSAHTTRKKVASQGKENLQNLGVNLSGVILNNIKSNRTGYYYSGYYHQEYSALPEEGAD